MVDGLQYATTHDKFFGSHVLGIPHGKLRFCMTGKRAFSCLCNTDSQVMPDKHDKLAVFQTQTFLQLIPDATAQLDEREISVLLLSYPVQKYRTSINCMTNFLKNKNAICNAVFPYKIDLSCMVAISTSTILLHRR